MCLGRVEKSLGLEGRDVVSALGGEGMVRAADIVPPGLDVTTVAATTGLLCNEEADIVVRMICGFEAARTEDAAIVECTIPAAMVSTHTSRKDDRKGLTCI